MTWKGTGSACSARLKKGEGPGQFIAPHGIAVDSRGDLYVAEVSFTIRGLQDGPAQGAPQLLQVRAPVVGG